jgi:hypothetical protein
MFNPDPINLSSPILQNKKGAQFLSCRAENLSRSNTVPVPFKLGGGDKLTTD